MFCKRTIAPFPQPIPSNSSAQNGALSHRPASHPCSTPCICHPLFYAQTDKVLPFPFKLLPMVPYAVPEPVAYPTINVLQFLVDTCHTEVVHPSSLDFDQFLDALRKTHRCGFPRYAFEGLFEFLPCLFPYYQLVLSSFALSVGRQKPKPSSSKLTGLRMPLFSRLMGSFNLFFKNL